MLQGINELYKSENIVWMGIHTHMKFEFVMMVITVDLWVVMPCCHTDGYQHLRRIPHLL